MAADGTKGPKPWKQYNARTTFIRVPAADWPLVRRGYKRVFVGNMTNVRVLDTITPSPVVAWSFINGSHDGRLMILNSVEKVVLGAVNPAELGFTSFAEFRRDWMSRDHRRFRPLLNVILYRIEPWSDERDREMREAVFNHLYGAFDGRPGELSEVA
jgi:hypothetical protein